MKRWMLGLLFAVGVFSMRAETYVVSVGISNYAYINSLNLPEKDATAIADLYRHRSSHVLLITGKNATKASILRALRSQFSQATSSDEIIFAYSGHGYSGGLCPYEMKKEADGLTYQEIWNELRNSAAGRKIIFADACKSGGFRVTKRQANETASKNIPVLTFLSSRTNELSQERMLMANGIFTTYLLRGLRGKADKNRDRKITARELFDYVSQGVKEKTNDCQHPVMWGKFGDDMVVIEW